MSSLGSGVTDPETINVEAVDARILEYLDPDRTVENVSSPLDFRILRE